MINTKEDLHHTFIDGSCEELKKKLLEKAKEFGLEVNPSAHKNLAIGINLAQVGKPSYFQVDHNGTHLEYYRDLLKYRELTLEDFEGGSKEESSSENTKCRYEKVDISPAEIYSAMLNGETFYVNEKEMYWNGNAFWCDCERVRSIEDTHEVCRKVEVTWQDEVLDYLKKPSDEGFEEELPSKFRVDFMDKSFHLVDSEFLEMCRVALSATGELK